MFESHQFKVLKIAISALYPFLNSQLFSKLKIDDF